MCICGMKAAIISPLAYAASPFVGEAQTCKVDPVQALIMALDLYERYEGSQH